MTAIVTLTPEQVAQLDPQVFADPDNPYIARSASGQQVALTPQRMADFLDSLKVMGSVAIACRRAGVARQTAYRARRRSPGFARAWDAATVAARDVAETELADRAINGVEEAVYYHGEEVARRRRFDARLLLAHLARLDRAAERLDVAATLPLLDEQIAALRDCGGDAGEVLPARVERSVLRQAQDERDWVRDPAAMAAKEAEAAEAAHGLRERSCGAATPAQAERRGVFGAEAGEGAGNSPQDGVTPVTPCPDPGPDPDPADPCPTCGGFCRDAQADARVALGEGDCQWLGNRLDRMDAARPAGALAPWQLASDSDPEGALEMAQLRAFEAGAPDWWELTFDPDGADGANGEGRAGAAPSAW
ncbi:MAG: hypothetical protein KDE15_05970 [Erythrobacter sp.]|nr:hypothetical protein [Erythrobacter sp.]